MKEITLVRSFAARVIGAWIVASAIALNGCSSKAADTSSASDLSSPPDSSSPADPADASSCAQPVWGPMAQGFTLTNAGGYYAAPVDGGCDPNHTLTFDYVDAVGSLVEQGCWVAALIHQRIDLTAAQRAQIVAALQGLQTVCGEDGCGADAPELTLTIRAGGGTPDQTYRTDFYSGCGGQIGTPPFISDNALGQFESLLAGFVEEACSGDAGSSSDSGTCTSDTNDGG